MVPLRVAINAQRRSGAYGGANRFANNLENHLHERGHEVFRHLAPGLDVVLLVSSRRSSEYRGINAFDYLDVRDYQRVYPDTAVVQRVNTCDEQRGEQLGNNEGMLEANEFANHTVFISEFIKKRFESKGMEVGDAWKVVHNGANAEVFNDRGSDRWTADGPLKIVTHHWSSNYLKGFDIYERLDQLLGREPYRDRFEFTFVGNKPYGLSLDNSTVVPPLSGSDLADELRRHHCYVTAARHEAGPNHVAEGLACGLPMLYLDTGALPEYCCRFGVEFDLTNFEEKLLELHDEYGTYRERVLEYDYTAEDAVKEYAQVIEEVASQRSSEPTMVQRLMKRVALRAVVRPYGRVRRLTEIGRKARDYLSHGD